MFVEIVGAPGYADHTRGRLIPGLGNVRVADDRGELAVVVLEVDHLAVVPASCVREIA